MDDLTAFLNARLDDEQRGAQFVKERENGVEVPVTTWLGVPFADRMLREVEAKRAAVAACIHTRDYEDYGWHLAEQVLVALASAYRDHPDYRDEWRP